MIGSGPRSFQEAIDEFQQILCRPLQQFNDRFDQQLPLFHLTILLKVFIMVCNGITFCGAVFAVFCRLG